MFIMMTNLDFRYSSSFHFIFERGYLSERIRERERECLISMHDSNKNGKEKNKIKLAAC